ncbi:hypothetical protein Moror_12143 [Moniliophthora roreri MCA 2997]|uniref:Uncharacterized protein n=2 Tax=Moniliophthora roreri TaxID=221103 RepID=V2WI89_MONRO|nr:hypothetical protein Moror_12143 [Moniliophthora roreri MCA 2997]
MDTPTDLGPSTQLISTSTTSHNRRNSSQSSLPMPSDHTLHSHTQSGNAISKSWDQAMSPSTLNMDPSGSLFEPAGMEPMLNQIDEEEEEVEEEGKGAGDEDYLDTPVGSRSETDDHLQKLCDVSDPEAMQIAEEAEML